MIVYKQNVDDVLREMNRAVNDMETLARMYPLNAPLSLNEAIENAHSAQDVLKNLRDHTPACRSTILTE